MSAVHTPNNIEDWDRSLYLDDASTMNSSPQNGVAFPGDGQSEGESMQFSAAGKGKRTLSELLKLHAEEGTDATFSPEEANRVAEVLGQWVSAQYLIVGNHLLFFNFGRLPVFN
ncbi:hypothetical protein PHLCEN_2v12703 [Hermanssonia centrifuga]|uniref:Uncharacterized protein n=2 Tax=Hermanssonia centrifuga TaxID=98765 RepID=A0A2R6NGF9_9APHY|nr:hypothetical protein PHLCEN_2v12703 [Hermanssonia centrifuga]